MVMALRLERTPEGSCAQSTPLVDRNTTPEAPTATKVPALKATADSEYPGDSRLAIQLVPVAEYNTAPLAPTATKTPSPKVTPVSPNRVPDEATTHRSASDDTNT